MAKALIENVAEVREAIGGGLPEGAVKPTGLRICWKCRKSVVARVKHEDGTESWECTDSQCGFTAPASGNRDKKNVRLAKVEVGDLDTVEGRKAEIKELYRQAKSVAFGKGGSDMIKVKAGDLAGRMLELLTRGATSDASGEIFSDLMRLPREEREKLLASGEDLMKRIDRAVKGEEEE